MNNKTDLTLNTGVDWLMNIRHFMTIDVDVHEHHDFHPEMFPTEQNDPF